MRRIFLCFSAVLFFFVPTALAQNTELDAIVSAVDGLIIPGCNPEILFFESEPWLSVVVTQSGPIAPMLTGTQVDGMVFTAETKTRIAWDDLFIDADAAAERVAAIAEASVYQNAYGNYSGIRPVPRDSFALFGSQLTVYYPAERLSTFSGNSGAFSFYAFELDGLLADGACFPAGNAGDAATALSDACLRGSLPGFLADWPIGRRMEEARNILLLEDIPDLSTDFALYRFEAPQMRGATLLSTTDDASDAIIEGIMSTRIDFSGLCTGVTSKTACIAALGQPERIEEVSGADAYSRLPDGETLVYQAHGREVRLHCVEDTLQSVTIL